MNVTHTSELVISLLENMYMNFTKIDNSINSYDKSRKKITNQTKRVSFVHCRGFKQGI